MKIKVIFIVLFFVSTISFSQNKGRIVYKVIHEVNLEKLSSGSGNSIIDQVSGVLGEIKDIKSRIPLNLDYNGQESVFYADKQTNLGLSDSKFYKRTIEKFNDYYRNDITKEALETINSEDKLFLVNSKTTDIQWTITNETKTIGDYQCIKATTTVWAHNVAKGKYEKIIEAWFAPSIPIKLGPKNYGGLLGLILELKDKNFTYYVTNINLKPDFEINIEKLKKGKAISKDDFLNSRTTLTEDEFRELFKARFGG